MITSEQVELVAAETLVPVSIVSGAALAVERRGLSCTAADLIPAVLNMELVRVPKKTSRIRGGRRLKS
ncbi:MAG: hypothetical protein WD602_02540 [Actinomycetota bacterium]